MSKIRGSFASCPHGDYQHFNASNLRVSWNGEIDSYVTNLGENTRVFLTPADAQHIVGQLVAELIVRGDAVDFARIASDAVAELKSLADDLKWNGDPKASARVATTIARLGYVAEAVKSE